MDHSNYTIEIIYRLSMYAVEFAQPDRPAKGNRHSAVPPMPLAGHQTV